MKTISSAAIFLCLIFHPFLIFAQYQEASAFNDPQGRISLRLGSGWVQMPIQSQGELGHYAYVQNGIVAAELSIASEVLPMILTSQQYAQVVEQNVLKGLPQYQKIQERTVNLSGIDATYYQFTMLRDTQMGKTQMVSEQYFMVLDNMGYLITIMALPSSFNAIKPVIDGVIQSLQRGGQNAPQYTTPINQQLPSVPVQNQPYSMPTTVPQQQNNPYAMPGDMTQLMNMQMRSATLTPPPLPTNPQQPMMNPQNIPTFPVANQTVLTQGTANPIIQTNPAATTGNQTTILPTLNSYQDPGGHFAILVPETFKPVQSPGATSFQGPQGQVIAIALVQDVNATLQAMIKDKQILDQRDAPVAAGTQTLTGKFYIYASTNPATGQSFVISVLGVPERNLIFTFTTAETQFEIDSDLIIQVIRSIDVHQK